MKIYLDNVIASGSVVSDLEPPEMAAVQKLITAGKDGRLEVVTSRKSWDEQSRASDLAKRSKLDEARQDIPVLTDDSRLLGITTVHHEGMFISYPILTGIVDEGLYATFVAAGLKDLDAQHLTDAVHNGCDRFVTTDNHFLKSRRATLEAACRGLRIVKPSELVAELGPA